MIEAVRAFWDAHPCNLRHGTSEIGTKEYWDQVEQKKYFVEPHIPGFAEFEKWKGKQVLEIGCGIGTDAVSFARAGANYTGTDLSEKSLDLARQRFITLGFLGAFYVSNAEELLIPKRIYDLVYSFGVLHHTPNPEKALYNIRLYMDRNSELRLMLYADPSWKGIMIEAGLDQPEASKGCPIARTYTRGAATDLLSEAGFDVLEMTQTHIFPYVISKYRQGIYERQPFFESMPDNVFKSLEARLGWHLLIKAILK
jgi:SAM-dependent methyltransferase